MTTRSSSRLVVTIMVLIALLVPSTAALAEGTETLGPPEISIENGSGYVAAGTGLIDSQPASINLDVPANSIVKQVLLYWQGHADCANDPTISETADCRIGQSITIDGHALTGDLIGGPTFFYTLPPPQYSLSYRSDITALALVDPGANSLEVSGVNFNVTNPTHGESIGFANGAAIVVIYDDGSVADVDIVDGNDNAFFDFGSPLDTTVPQTFNFASEPVERTADLALLVGSVVSPEYVPGGPRPTRIVVTVNGVDQYYDNVLSSADGPSWDTLILPITIPAGASSLTVQILSADALNIGALPSSFSWVAAALSVPITPTANGVGAGTPGYWMNHPDAWPVDEIEIGGETYTKSEAIEIMKTPGKGDKTYDMFMHLVAAKLNVAIGAESSCITDTIVAGDAWLATNKLGTNVRANSAAWQNGGEAIKNTLDDYNNGKLCAPSRDTLK
jgi:hypothetical protein